MRLNIYGSQPIITPRDPVLPMEAANKKYVDDSILNHANNLGLHLTVNQNLLLDSITVTSDEINSLDGVTGNIQTQVNSKLSLAGGTLTGPLNLAANPVFNLEATTKQYTDAADSLKVNKAGDTMTGYLVLSGDPISGLHAAPKQYVDSTLASHANDVNLHLTPAQNSFLDAITVTAGEVNELTGVSGNVQAQLNSKFDKAGGLISGDVTLAPNKTIFVSKAPATGTEVVNKAYVDSLIVGQKWENPVTDIGLVQDNLSTPPASPVSADVYIVGPSATGAWVGKEGYAVYHNGSIWVQLQNRPVAIGDRFGVSLVSSTVPAGGLVGMDGKIVTITNATPGSIAYALDVLEPGSTTLVFDPDSSKFGVSYTMTDEGNWVPTNTSVNLTAGAGLSLSGNILNVNTGNGITISSDIVEVNLDLAGGMEFLASKLKVKLDGSTITSSNNGIKVSDTVMADIADKVSKTGTNSITGNLTIESTGKLSLNTTPTVSSDAVNKGYVDSGIITVQSQISNIQTQLTVLNNDPVTKTYVDTQDATKVNKAGDTMTGALVLSGNPTNALHAAPKQYIDSLINSHSSDSSLHLTPTQNSFLDAITVTSTEVNQLTGVSGNVQTQIDGKLNLVGGVMTGLLTLSGDPTSALNATTKQYTDAADNLKVNKAGDTMTGALVLSGNPTNALHAAPKQYVDSLDSAQKTYVDTQDATKVNKAGDTMTGALVLSGDPTNALHAAPKQYVDSLDSIQKTYIDTQDATLQTQITALQSSVTVLNLDPVTKSYVDSRDNTKLDLSGGTMSGYMTLHADPQQAMHAVTKQYVDSVAQGLVSKPSVRLATTVNLAGVYNNGTFGVNSTLTGLVNGAITVDGKTPIVGDRILVRAQTNGLENGDYTVQQVGNVGSPFILKRVSTVDKSSEVSGSYFYVYDGDTLKGTGWVLTVANPITFSIGTDVITVNQFSGQGSLIAGNGLTLTGNTIDVNTANPSRIVVNYDSIDLAVTGVTPGSYTKVTTDGYGRITAGSNPNTISGYGITDAQPLNPNLTSLSNVSAPGIIVRDNTNTMVAKSIIATGVGITVTNGGGGSVGNIVIESNATSNSVGGAIVSRDSAGNFSANIITADLTGNASTATTLETTRDFSISGDVVASSVNFNGSSNVNLVSTLSATGVTAGEYTKLTVDAKGRVTSGSAPTTIAGLGVQDVYTKAQVDAIIADLISQINEIRLFNNPVI